MQELSSLLQNAVANVDSAVAGVASAVTSGLRDTVDEAVRTRRLVRRSAADTIREALQSCEECGVDAEFLDKCPEGQHSRSFLDKMQHEADKDAAITRFAQVRCQVGFSVCHSTSALTEWSPQELNVALEAYYDAEDTERDTRIAYDVLETKRRRGTSFVSQTDATAGKEAVEKARRGFASARVTMENAMDLLAAFQSSRFPEVSFHLYAADWWGLVACKRLRSFALCRGRASLQSGVQKVSSLDILSHSGLLVQRSLKVMLVEFALWCTTRRG